MGGAMSGGDRVANGQDTFPADGLPVKPEMLKLEESVYWDTLIDQIPHEILRRIDAHQLLSLCQELVSRDIQYARYRNEPDDKESFSMWMRSIQAIERASRIFGLGPLDRRRMKLSGQADEDPVDDW